MIHKKTPEEIGIMAEGGRILSDIIKKLKEAVRPGITTKDLDTLANELVSSHGVKPAFLNYGGFPATLCVSVNDEVVHGVPSDTVLNEGDIVGLDMGIVYQGFVSDSAVTVPVLGNLSYEAWAGQHPDLHKLLKITEEALYAGIKQARSGNRLGKVSAAIQEVIEGSGFGVVRDLVGHGIGRKLHEEPHVPNYGKREDGPELEEGMVLAIEPMANLGNWQVKMAPDKFTFKTKDGSYSAHFEHTVAVLPDGPVILTK